MPNNYVAPYLYNGLNVPLPAEGTFIVPVCTTRERFDKIMNALWWYGAHQEDFDFDHLIDWLDACSRIQPGCEYDPTENCRVIPLDSPQLTWFPESPYAPGEEVPSGYLNHPWTLVDSSILSTIIAGFGLGYKTGDVFTDILHIPFDEYEPENIYNNYQDLPNIRVNGLIGRGVVRLHLLGIPQGGRLGLFKNGVVDLFALQLVETNKDLGSFPPETQTATIVEVTFESAGENFLDIVWLPVLDEGIVPLFYGGGIRAIELCGFGMPLTDPCCPDDEVNSEINQYQLYIAHYQAWLNQNTTQQSTNLNFYDGTPTSLFPGAGENFNSTGDSILCDAIEMFLTQVIYALATSAAAASGLAAIGAGVIAVLAAALGLLTAGWSIVLGVALNAALFAGTAFWMEVVNDPEAQRKVRCCMFDALKDTAFSPATFSASLSSCGFDGGSREEQLASIVSSVLGYESNYRAFLFALSQAAGTDAENCECGCDVTEYNIVAMDNSTVEKLSDTTYRITQSHINSSDPAHPNARTALIREEFYRCFKISDEGLQGQSDSSYRDCSGVDIGVPTGGFEGVEGIRFQFRQYENDIDTIITIVCPGA